MSTTTTPKARLHLKLAKRWVLECHLEPRSYLHVGTTRDEFSLTDVHLPVFTLIHPKTGNRTPIIPGSSLKGMLRSYFYLAWRNISLDSWKKVIDPSVLKDWENILKQLNCKDNRSYYDEKYSEIETQFIKFQEEDVEEITQKKLEKFELIDPVNKLFGMSGHASCIKVSTAFPLDVDEDVESYITTQYGIDIDVDVDKVKKGHLFTRESIDPSLQFTFYLVFDELDDPSMKLPNLLMQKILLDRLLRGERLSFTLGGHQSRGLGNINIKAIQYLECDAIDLFKGKTLEWKQVSS